MGNGVNLLYAGGNKLLLWTRAPSKGKRHFCLDKGTNSYNRTHSLGGEIYFAFCSLTNLILA